jgi:Protein of unknown function (DUF5131)
MFGRSELEFDRRWKFLQKVPTVIKFISYEPALAPLKLPKHDRLPDWLISGGESGPGRGAMSVLSVKMALFKFVINSGQFKSEKSADCSAGTFGFGGIMPVRKASKYEEYRLYAEHCLKLVRLATNRESRVIQRQMSAEWFKLADMFFAAEQPAE